jgi:uncharacterized protein (DUF1778 family)
MNMPVSAALPKRETLNLRIRPDDRRLMDRAAALQGKNRTEFVLDAVRRAANDALLDRTLLNVSAEEHARYLALFDAPPKPNDRLKRAMRTAAPWEDK